MGDIGKLLDASITGVDMPAKPAPVMDLSKIDFEALGIMKPITTNHCVSRFSEMGVALDVRSFARAQLEKLIRFKQDARRFRGDIRGVARRPDVRTPVS